MKNPFGFNMCHTLLYVIIFYSCSSKQSSETKFVGEYSDISLKKFKINGLELLSSKDSLVKYLGIPNREIREFSSKDTLTTIFYLFDDAEISFIMNNDSATFSYVSFGSSNYQIKNSLAVFSSKTKFDAMKIAFPDSYLNSEIRGAKTLMFVKINELPSMTLRFEFIDDLLNAIYLDAVVEQ